MLKQLFDDSYSPITSEIGFLECDAKTASDAFMEWQNTIQSERGVYLSRRELSGDFQTKLEALLPLTSVEARRFLFLPTRGNWTAYFDSGWRGTDVFSAVSTLCERISCRGIRAVCTPHTIRKESGVECGKYGATMLEVYSADSSGCSFLNILRSISAANDGGRWGFDANGEILPFEQVERYTAKKVRDRFTPEMLDQYLAALGIHFFSPDFYNADQIAYLVSKDGPCAPEMKEYSLSAAREGY